MNRNGPVELLDVDAAVLQRLGGVGDLQEFAGGLFGIGGTGDQRRTSSRARLLRVESLATIPHGILAFCPVSLITPSLIVSLGAACREDPPRCLEVGASLIETVGGACGAFARPRAGVKAAVPAPRVLVDRDARADRDGADADVAIEDAPAFLEGFGIATAGEGGHTPLKRGEGGIGKPLPIAMLNGNGPREGLADGADANVAEVAVRPL